MIQSPLLGVEVIHESNEDPFIESMVSEPLSHMGPVLLFHVGVIVFSVRDGSDFVGMVGSASGELDGFLSLVKVSHQVPIEKFRAVIAVKAKQGERQGVFDILDLSKDFFFSLTPDGSLFGPAGGDIDRIDGIGKLVEQAFSAVGDGIGFQKPWLGFIPLVGFNRDLFSQQGAGFCGTSSPASVFDPGRS